MNIRPCVVLGTEKECPIDSRAKGQMRIFLSAQVCVLLNRKLIYFAGECVISWKWSLFLLSEFELWGTLLKSVDDIYVC